MRCAEVRERAPEFALGALVGSERAETVEHLHGCASCRREVDGLTAAVDAVTLLAPEADPPIGFEEAFAARIRGDRRRVVRRWVALVAVVAATAAIVAVAAVRIVQVVDEGTPVAATNTELRAAPMIGGGGRHVGHAFVYHGSPSWVSVTIGYVLPTGDYRVEGVQSGGRVVDLGSMHVDRGKGAWGGSVHASVDRLVAVQLRSSSGPVVCRALLSSS
ncbi:MAG: zf-HC2 domain-containing protein [Acidimicrobiia bacterium]